MMRCLALIVLSAGLVPAALGADPSIDGLGALVESRFTEVDLDGDGRPDVSRAFDSAGSLSEMETSLVLGGTHFSEKVVIRRGPPEIRERTIRAGGVVLRKVIERFGAGGTLTERETLWGSSEDGKLDRRTHEVPEGSRVRITTHALEKRQWKLRDTKEMSALSASRRNAAAVAAAAQASRRENLDRYVRCHASSSAGVDTNSCRMELESLDAELRRAPGFDFGRFANLECRDGETLFLPNGYTVDLLSCGTPAAVNSLRAASRDASGEMLSCLNQVNPAFARKFAATLVERRPLLRCGGDPSRVDFEGLFCASGTPEERAECSARIARTRGLSAAFVMRSRPGEIFLTASDPMNPSQTAMVDPVAGYPIGLAGTLFHETLHSCGHHGGDRHDEGHFNDDVYGCHALCGGASEYATTEGCEACVRGYPPAASPVPTVAEGRNPAPSAQLLSDCREKLPPARIIRAFRNAESLQTLIRGCESETLNFARSPRLGGAFQSCDSLRATPEHARLCAGSNMLGVGGNGRCENLLRIEAARQIREVWTLSGRARAVEHFLHNHIPRVADGRITTYQLDIGSSTEGVEIERAKLMTATLVDGFCVDLGETGAHDTYRTDPENAYLAFARLRQQYDRDIPVPLTNGLNFRRESGGPAIVQPVLNKEQYALASNPEQRAQSVQAALGYCRTFRAQRDRFFKSDFILRSL